MDVLPVFDGTQPGIRRSLLPSKSNPSFLEYVTAESWQGGLALGIIWSTLLCSCIPSTNPTCLEESSPLADMLSSFSTLSQEKRHEFLPSWYSVRAKTR
jgi:hypothetical protein